MEKKDAEIRGKAILELLGIDEIKGRTFLLKFTYAGSVPLQLTSNSDPLLPSEFYSKPNSSSHPVDDLG